MTTDPTLLARLAQHRALGSAPAAEHAWLAERGEWRSLAVGDVLARKGEATTSLYVLFTGHIAIRTDRGAGAHTLIEQRGGDVSGHLPFSRGTVAPNDVVVEAPTDLLVLGHEHCGAVAAAVADAKEPGHIAGIVKAIRPAVKRTRGLKGDPVENAVRANVQDIAARLRVTGPILAAKVKAGRLEVLGATVSLSTGKVEPVPDGQ